MQKLGMTEVLAIGGMMASTRAQIGTLTNEYMPPEEARMSFQKWNFF
jgi:hypothetical protein